MRSRLRQDPVETSAALSWVMVTATVVSGLGAYLLAHRLPQDSDSPNYLLAAIPFYFLLMGVEAVLLACGAAQKSQAGHYESTETWASMSAGIVQTVILAGYRRAVPFAVWYAGLYEKYSVVQLPDNGFTLVLAFVLCDFLYYWLHRHTHVYAFLWAGHAAHHSGERYNLSNALRQSWWQGLHGPLWYVPLALLIPPKAYLPATSWVTLYQFWVHTCTVRRLPWPLELILATPSHHRVHHDRRVHKNFGGVFIVWDRLFGTFQDELEHRPSAYSSEGDEICYFGIREVTPSWTEPVLQLQHWASVAAHGAARFVQGPGWVTAFKPRPLPVACAPSVRRFRLRTQQTTVAFLYHWVQFAVALAIALDLLGAAPQLNASELLGRMIFVIASLATQGLMLDGRSPIAVIGVEALRLLVVLTGTLLPQPFLASPRLSPPVAFAALSSAALLLAAGRSVLGTTVRCGGEFNVPTPEAEANDAASADGSGTASDRPAHSARRAVSPKKHR